MRITVTVVDLGNRCRRDLEDVVGDRDRVAGQVADAIRNVVDDDLKIPSVTAFGLDVAEQAGLLDPLKELPIFNLQPGGSW